ncbi:phage protein GemA/Gp16 family protein [Neisseriaceae bacterium B1]
MRSNANHRKGMIAKIKIAQKQLGMEDDIYRDLPANISRGKTSSKLLTTDQLEKVLQHMKAQGFQVSVATTGGRDLMANQTAQQNKIRALWLELHDMGVVRSPADSALNAYCVKYGSENWQDDVMIMRGLIERLKKWKARFE